MKKRAVLYVDGFNLYYAIKDLQKPHYKWLNLWRLGQKIIRSRDEFISRVVFCSAFVGDKDKLARHRAYVRALQLVGVTPIMGHYVREPMNCHNCGHSWGKSTEKETDINLALAVYDDAQQGVCDHAYLVTADSDQAATARMLKLRFPSTILTTVSPPGRPHSQHILRYADAKIALNEGHLDRAVFPGFVTAAGEASVVRPREYDPPPGWVHPDDRP